MPMLSERTNLDLSHYTSVTQNADNLRPQALSPTTDLAPGYNPYTRCPLPPIWTTSPDSLRSFYSGTIVPQVRIFNPASPTNNSGTTNETIYAGSTTSTASSSSSSSSSSSGSSTTTSVLQTAIITPSLQPNLSFVGSVNMSRVFALIGLSCNSSCRVRLYGSSSAQLTDLSRGLDIAPPAGTTLNLITDVILDTSPYVWQFQDRSGSNQDNPRTSQIYITITNIAMTTASITTTISYAPVVV